MNLPSVRLSCLILACLFVFPLAGQSIAEEALQRYRETYLPEKVFVHTDKSIYAGGETIWAAVYLVDGQTHRADSISGVIHLELRNLTGEVIQARKLYPYRGHTAGDLSPPASLPPGAYEVVAYTNYQRNGDPTTIFRKRIQLVSGLKESGGVTTAAPMPESSASELAATNRLRFFPEGGDCVVGQPCRVAVVAEGPAGNPSAVRGNILSNDGQRRVNAFATGANGTGTFLYTPVRDGRELARVDGWESTFDLPPVLTEGLNLQLVDRRDSLQLTVFSNLPSGVAGTSLLFHVRGIPLFSQLFTQRSKRARLLLGKANLPPGVITVTAFNDEQHPVAERLFYVPPAANELRIEQPETATIRSPVRVRLGFPGGTTDADSLPSGRLSLSIVPASLMAELDEGDIRTWLLLNSDLDRPLADARELLFGEDGRPLARKLDEYLLTRQWRRFRWAELMQPKPPVLSHALENGIYVRGRMGQYDDHSAPRPGKVFLTRTENAFFEESLTDPEGNFSFGPYTVFDTLDLMVQGRFKFGKKNRLNPEIGLDANRNVHLELTQPPPPNLPAPQLPPEEPITTDQALADYQELSRKSLTVARTYDSLIIDLAVVEITTKRIDEVEESRRSRTLLYGTPDSRIDIDSVPGGYSYNSFLDFIRQVPGVQVIGEKVLIRGTGSLTLSTEPAYFLDGFQTDAATLAGIPVPEIEFIDVLKGASASAFGARGANGVILVYTRDGTAGTSKEPGLLRGKLYGYHRAREFAVFDATLPENRNRPDLRTTLHWNPLLFTDRNGEASETLMTSDQTGRFRIIAQGLRGDGLPFFGTAIFTVE